MMEPFDPKRHKSGVTLLEIVSKKVDDQIVTSLQPTDVPFRVAAITPWYYYVETEPVKATIKLKGGPTSGWYTTGKAMVGVGNE